ESKRATPVNTLMIRTQNSHIANMENVLVVWVDEIIHNIPLAKKGLILSNFIEAERDEEAAEKFEARRGWFMRFKESSHLHNIKIASADIEAAASFPEDLPKIIDKDGYTKQQISVNETAFHWKKMLSGTFIAREKSMPSFKGWADLLGASAVGNLKLKPVLILRKTTKSALLCKCNNKAWITEYFKLSVEIYYTEKKISLKILVLIDSAPSRALMEMYKEHNVFFPVNTVSILQPIDQGVISTFKSYLRNTFHKTLPAIDSDSSDGSMQSKLETFYVIKNICDSWKEVKISVTGIGRKVIPTFMDDFEGFKASVEEVTADVIEIARELEPDYVTELLQSHYKTWGGKELPLTDEQRKWFPEMELTPGEGPVNNVDMTTKDLEYYINLVDKAATANFDSNFERSSVGQMLSNGIACFREFQERKRQSMWQTSLSSHFKKLPQPPQP
uniref:DDE-1 domain-containing protein n=1 Tax=Chlorocebus sabaeus TaxID=60711 RepID=A0A0D9RJQ6_CHLSB